MYTNLCSGIPFQVHLLVSKHGGLTEKFPSSIETADVNSGFGRSHVAVPCRRFHAWHGQIVYVESIARVTSLSLSGKILYHTRVADLFMVQWPELQSQCPLSKYCGRLY